MVAAPAPSPVRDSPAALGDVVRTFFRHASPRILATLVVAAGVARLIVGDFSAWDLVVIGLLLLWWPLQEWLIHVFILHYRPRQVLGRTLDFDVPRKHRAHHADPWRQELIFIPVHVFVYAPLLLSALFYVLAPTPALAATTILAYFALALHYEWVHFFVHTRYRPRSAHYRRLWRNHRLHHFKNEQYWYGVTMLSGDRLLSTQPDADETPTSPTARSLGFEDGVGEAT